MVSSLGLVSDVGWSGLGLGVGLGLVFGLVVRLVLTRGFVQVGMAAPAADYHLAYDSPPDAAAAALRQELQTARLSELRRRARYTTLRRNLLDLDVPIGFRLFVWTRGD